MNAPRFASITAKVVAGVAGVAIATGTAGTVIALQPVSDDKPAEVRAADTTTTTTAAPTTTTTVAPTTTTTVASSTAQKDHGKADEDHGKAEDRERKDNFGALVSEDARDGGVEGQEISAKAHARNEERKAARADDEPTKADDDEDDDDHPGQGRGRDHAED